MAFPNNPNPGDTYTDEYGTVWVYAGPINGWYRQTVIPVNDTTYIGSDGAPGGIGNNTEVVFNDNGSLASDSGLTYNKTTDALSGGAFVPTGSTVPSNGVYRPSANNVAISTNGTGRLFVDASGKVGVGDVPSLKFNVYDSNAGASLATALFANTGTTASTESRIHLQGGSAFPRSAYIGGILESASGNPHSFVIGTSAAYSSPTERLRITSDGKLGVGTSSPEALCHISGSDAAARGQLHIKATGTPYAHISLQTSANGRGIYLDNNDSNKLKIYTGTGRGAADEVVIDNSGRVGIGTTSPGQALDVVGPSGSNTPLTWLRTTGTRGYLYSDGGGVGISSSSNLDEAGIYFQSNSNLSLRVSGSERARIDSSGRLLVGTSTSRTTTNTPQILTESVNTTTGDRGITIVNGGASVSSPILNFAKHRSGSIGGITTVNSGDYTGALIFNGSDGTDFIQSALIAAQVDGTPGANDMPGRLVFSTTADGASSPTERMRIASNGICSLPNGGAIGIGTDAALMSSGGRLRIHGDFYNASGGIALTTTDDSNNAVYIDFGNSSATRVGQVRRASSTSVAYDTTSDYRLKENITPFQNAIERLSQLNPVRFSWIVDAKEAPDVDGFLAHEVQQVVPEAAGGFKDQVDDEGNPVYQGIDQSKLVPLLTAALQEALAKIETLEARLDAANL